VHGTSPWAGKEGRAKFKQQYGQDLDKLRADLTPQRWQDHGTKPDSRKKNWKE
jgi:hypothetical protein